MVPEEETLISRAQTSYRKLATAAVALNTASDQLGKVIVEVDAALKALNLGISSWISFNEWVDDGGSDYSCDQIGYSKVGGKWGIALRSLSGNYNYGEGTEDGPWLFNDAPRALRVAAIDKIPEFLEKLAKDAVETTKKINEKLQQSRELAKAITVLASAKDKPPKEGPKVLIE
jgi:hypothetical protein